MTLVPTDRRPKDEELTLTLSAWQRQQYGPDFAIISVNLQSFPITSKIECYDDASAAAREQLVYDAMQEFRQRLLDLRDELNELTRVE